MRRTRDRGKKHRKTIPYSIIFPFSFIILMLILILLSHAPINKYGPTMIIFIPGKIDIYIFLILLVGYYFASFLENFIPGTQLVLNEIDSTFAKFIPYEIFSFDISYFVIVLLIFFIIGLLFDLYSLFHQK